MGKCLCFCRNIHVDSSAFFSQLFYFDGVGSTKYVFTAFLVGIFFFRGLSESLVMRNHGS